MVFIKIDKGLDIPIKGKPEGEVQTLKPSGDPTPILPQQIALDLTSFSGIKFKVLVKLGDSVRIGQPLLEDRDNPGGMFCSPAGGVVAEIRRGHQRIVTHVIIDVAKHEEYHPHKKIDLKDSSRDEIIQLLKEGGMFSRIRTRPFNRLTDPDSPPRSIFIKAIESAPFVPPAELQVEGHEKDFQVGLDTLKRLVDGSVHLVYREKSNCNAFTQAQNVALHQAEGPHPIGNVSVHINHIDPIKSPQDIIWTLNVHDIIAIGHLIETGHYLVDRVISIAGPGFLEDRTGYYKAREGMPISALISGRLPGERATRLISGDPLMGSKVEAEGFLGFNHFVLCAIPENEEREFLHFFRLGIDKYSFSKTYLSGHLNPAKRAYDFTTNLHGEHRAFIDSTLYDKVMPLPISTMLLVKAVMAEDYDLAAQLGLNLVDSEDFALPTFVCQSKMEMPEIIKTGLRQYAHDLLD